MSCLWGLSCARCGGEDGKQGRAEPACPAGRCKSLCSPRPCQAASMGVRWGKKGEIGYFCPWHKCRPPHQLPPAGPQPWLPRPPQQTLLQSQGHVLPFGFCSWGVSVSQPWREFMCVPNHGLIPTGMDGTAACSGCRCGGPALGVGIGTARTPGLIEQKPPFGCRKVSEVLPHSSLTSPLSFCPFAGFGAMLLTPALPASPGLSRVTNTRADIYLLSQPPSPPPSLWALWPLHLFVPFFTHFSGHCVFTSPVCFE